MEAEVDEQLEAAESGTIESAPVPLLLARAWHDRRSGWLVLAIGGGEKRIRLVDGAPVAVESQLARDGFARALEESNAIGALDRQRVEELAKSKACAEAVAVHALGLLEAGALYKALRRYTRNQIAETFEWREGSYRWLPADPGAESSASRPFDVIALLQEQLPRRWGTERLFESLMPDCDRVAELAPRFRRVALKLADRSEPASRLIARLDGSGPIGRVLGECAGDPAAATALWILINAGMLRTREAARAHGDEAPDVEIQVEVREAPSGDAKAAHAAVGALGRRPGPAPSDKALALRSEIEDLLARLSELGHYDALGLAEDANAGQIKKAYFQAAKKYHPDALARLGLDELREDAARVFARIAEAFEVLSDPDKKAAYDAGGSDDQVDMTRLAQAETSFRKGEILAKMGNYAGALEYLEPAVELWPEEPAYQSGLGWALYKQSRSEPERARTHLETAHQQAPEEPGILYRLGVVLRALGEQERGEGLIAQARRLDPTLEE